MWLHLLKAVWGGRRVCRELLRGPSPVLHRSSNSLSHFKLCFCFQLPFRWNKSHFSECTAWRVPPPMCERCRCQEKEKNSSMTICVQVMTVSVESLGIYDKSLLAGWFLAWIIGYVDGIMWYMIVSLHRVIIKSIQFSKAVRRLTCETMHIIPKICSDRVRKQLVCDFLPCWMQLHPKILNSSMLFHPV